jgi:hypothetical protein
MLCQFPDRVKVASTFAVVSDNTHVGEMFNVMMTAAAASATLSFDFMSSLPSAPHRSGAGTNSVVLADGGVLMLPLLEITEASVRRRFMGSYHAF